MNSNLICSCKLADVMRKAAPVPGSEFDRMVRVNLKPGESVPAHQHDHDTVLYYPADAAPLVITPVAGLILYVPAGTPHAVPVVDSDRVSVAMLLEQKPD